MSVFVEIFRYCSPTPESEQVRDKRYHVILHYEEIVEAESKFEALHNTLLGNTVVENAKSAVIKIPTDVQQQTLCKEWNF